MYANLKNNLGGQEVTGMEFSLWQKTITLLQISETTLLKGVKKVPTSSFRNDWNL